VLRGIWRIAEFLSNQSKAMHLPPRPIDVGCLSNGSLCKN
jgi:hypothetical protein